MYRETFVCSIVTIYTVAVMKWNLDTYGVRWCERSPSLSWAPSLRCSIWMSANVSEHSPKCILGS